MAKRLFRFGEVMEDAMSMELSHKQAREYARCQRARGLVWMFHRNHWHIVANYNDGRVWNGQAHIVPTALNPKEDWEAIAQGV